MKTNCINCNAEIESEGKKPRKYCSDKCRMIYKRTNEQPRNEQTTNEQETNKHCEHLTIKDEVLYHLAIPETGCTVDLEVSNIEQPNKTDIINQALINIGASCDISLPDNLDQIEQEIEPPDGLPAILHSRYRRDAEYRTVIDRLLDNTIEQLRQMNVFIPVWRYNMEAKHV